MTLHVPQEVGIVFAKWPAPPPRMHINSANKLLSCLRMKESEAVEAGRPRKSCMPMTPHFSIRSIVLRSPWALSSVHYLAQGFCLSTQCSADRGHVRAPQYLRLWLSICPCELLHLHRGRDSSRRGEERPAAASSPARGWCVPRVSEWASLWVLTVGDGCRGARLIGPKSQRAERAP